MTPKNFSALILNLYQDGHISFDDDMREDLTATAVMEIQKAIWPHGLLNFGLRKKGYLNEIIKRERQHRRDNARRWAKHDAEQRRNELKSIACCGWESMNEVYGKKPEKVH